MLMTVIQPFFQLIFIPSLADKHFPDGLKFHFASVFLDELDGAGNAEPSLVTELLKPFADLLLDNSISQYLFKSIIDEIFLTILTAYEAEQASISTSEGDERGESANAENRLKFDNGGIAELLFNIGKNPALSGDRRKKLYHVSKKFKVAEQHSEFFRQLDRVPSRINTGIHRSKLKAAALRLLSEEQKEVAEARRVRKNLESMKSPDIDVIGRKKNVRCLKKSNNAEDRRLFKHKKKLGVKKSRDILAKRSKKRLGGKKR
ncbi:hypothetical protein AB6A40_009603 [Gnathostoma spinigerum]|uniref:Uncharacterized protein n=1 Tax=Gnathostoma spinigerum TaxID=75299 RepID=A0ABD6EZV3_9BILA